MKSSYKAQGFLLKETATMSQHEDMNDTINPIHIPFETDIKLLNNHHFVDVALKCLSSGKALLFTGQLLFLWPVRLNGIFTKFTSFLKGFSIREHFEVNLESIFSSF